MTGVRGWQREGQASGVGPAVPWRRVVHTGTAQHTGNAMGAVAGCRAGSDRGEKVSEPEGGAGPTPHKLPGFSLLFQRRLCKHTQKQHANTTTRLITAWNNHKNARMNTQGSAEELVTRMESFRLLLVLPCAQVEPTPPGHGCSVDTHWVQDKHTLVQWGPLSRCGHALRPVAG